ncbi:MAG: YusW family protein [Lysinibacillus sp.]
MKKSIALIACCSLLLLGACNDNDEVTNPPDNAPSEDSTNNGNTNGATDSNNGNTTGATDSNNNQSSTNQMQTSNIPFSSFDLDVEYDQFKSFEVEYENEASGMEAKIKDELNNRKISGDEAFQELQSRFEQFKFDASTSEQDVINEVLKSFELSDNYNEFELDVQFADGTEKEYNLIK